MGLLLPPDGAALTAVDEAEGNYRAVWVWPERRFTEKCRFAVSAQAPSNGEALDGNAAIYATAVDRAEWDAAGGAWLLKADASWHNAFAVVTAVVECGFQTFFSRPLVLGQFTTQRWWKRLFTRGTMTKVE
jgi:hypothetical protein